ncbi:hypothetical protein [Candidatus Nitrososphaera gargensis]|nr:hypothetical protein [Candidatus Nitrososphaera gargensis]
MAQNPSSFDKETQKAKRQQAKKSVAKWLVVLGTVLAIVLASSTYLLEPILSSQHVRYLQVTEVAIIGFFAIQLITSVSYNIYVRDRI